MRARIRDWIERRFHARVTECTVLRVVDTRRLTPHMLHVTFEGRSLDAFATDDNLHVKLLLPPEGAPRYKWLTAGRDGKARLPGKGVDPVFRKYTIRAIDSATGRVAIDFVCHADGGPGAAWATTAQAGDVIGMIGPGGRGILPADWYLLAGDETALPAIGRILESLPRDAKGLALVEIDGPKEQQALAVPDGMTLQWLHRNGAPAGTTDLLANAVKAASWPAGGIRFAWVAAEFSAVQAIRRHLRSSGLGKQEQLVVAYWRREATDAGRRE